MRKNKEQTLIAIEIVNAFIDECVKAIAKDKDFEKELEQIIISRCAITKNTLNTLKSFINDLDIEEHMKRKGVKDEI